MKVVFDLWSVLVGVGLCLSPVVLIALNFVFVSAMERQKTKNAQETYIGLMRDPELIKSFLNAYEEKHGPEATVEDLFEDLTRDNEETPSKG